jgi:hypothetical protein
MRCAKSPSRLRKNSRPGRKDVPQGSGRTMARTGLRMMPTFPSSPLKFRTAGFPRYGFKAGVSAGAFPRAAPTWRALPVCIPPSCPPLPACLSFSAQCRSTLCTKHCHASGYAALPQGPSLRSGFCCPGPSSLMRPHPPHSQAQRDFTVMQLIRPAFAVRFRLGDPRLVPCFHCSFFLNMSSSTTPGSLAAVFTQSLHRQHWPSSL